MSQMKSNHRYDGNLPFGRAEIKALLGLQEALTGLQEQVAGLQAEMVAHQSWLEFPGFPSDLRRSPEQDME
jgi:hypothetical protein